MLVIQWCAGIGLCVALGLCHYNRRRPALLCAAARGPVALIPALIALGAPVNARDDDGRVALHYAACHSAEGVRLLAAAGAHLGAFDTRQWSRWAPLDYAIAGSTTPGAPEVAALLAAGAPADADHLFRAARRNNVAAIQALLAARVPVDGSAPDPRMVPAPSVVRRRLAKADAFMAGVMAAAGFTPLHAAAEGGHLEAVDALLAAGADPNAVAARAYSAAPYGTPADVARAGGHERVLARIQADPRYVSATTAL